MRNGKSAGESDSKSWTFFILGDWSSVSEFFKNDLFAYCACCLFCWGLRLYLDLDDSSSAARFDLSLNKRMFCHSVLFLLSGIFRPFCLVGFLCVSFLTAFQDWPTFFLSLVLFCHFNYAYLCHWNGFNRSFRCFACCFWLRFCFCWCTWQRWWLVHLRWYSQLAPLGRLLFLCFFVFWIKLSYFFLRFAYSALRFTCKHINKSRFFSATNARSFCRITVFFLVEYIELY